MIRKTIFLMVSVLSVLSARGEGGWTPYFSCDFSDGLPAGATVEDRDGAELHFLMKQAGFAQGDSWKVILDRSAANHYIGSPSMHKTAKGETPVAADDHFTLPPVLIRGGEATISWRCRSVNAQTGTPPSTYTVLVNGNKLTDGYTAPVNEWADVSHSLAGYTGQNVTVTFINNTLGGEVLALDDITIGGLAGTAAVEASPGEWVLGEESFRPGVKVTATSPDEPVTSLSVTCVIGTESYTASATNLNLTAGQEHTLLVDHTVTGRYGDSFTYTLMPEVNGIAHDAIVQTTRMAAFRTHRRTVLEESTGQWCGWCPLGIHAIEELHAIFGDDVIPIAIHVGRDDMAFDEYAQAVGLCDIGSPSAPLGYFDREVFNTDPMPMLKVGLQESYTVWNGGFATDAEKRLKADTDVEITVEATLRDDNTLDVRTVSRAARDLDDAGMKVALTLVEDDVWKDGYMQANYLADFPQRGPVGDFMSRPDKITDNFAYRHVARAVAEDAWDGIPGSLPATIVAGEEYRWDYTWAIPSSVLNPHALKVVAMVIDARGHIANAAQAPADPSYSSAECVPAAERKTVYYNLQGLPVSSPEKGRILIEVSASGARKIIF